MKFKTIFLLFNLVVLFAFLFVALVPFFMLGSDFSKLFWSQNWILVILFFLFIILLDGYFVLNWKLFIYLEKEDWPGLMTYLEDRIYKNQNYKVRYLTLYVNTCLSVSNLDKINRLEMEVREKKPDVLGPIALSLGIPYLLKKDNSETEQYFRESLKLDHLKDANWLSWGLAFSLIGQKKLEEAIEPLLNTLKGEKRDKVLLLLVLFMLDSLRTLIPSEDQDLVSSATLVLKKQILSQSDWEKALSKSRDKNLLPSLLTALIQDARDWLKQVEG